MLSVIAALIWTAVNVIDKYIIGKEIRDPYLATVIQGIVAFILFGIFSIIWGSFYLLSINMILWSVLAGIFYSLAILFYYLALEKVEVSRFAPVLSSIPIFVLIFAFIFLNERLLPIHYLGIVFIVFGAAIISYKKVKGKVQLGLGIFLTVFSAILFAIRSTILKYVETSHDIWSIAFWLGIGCFITSIIIFACHHPHIKKKSKKGIGHLYIIHSLRTAGFLLYFVAISIGSVSLVTALVEIKSVLIFLIATFLTFFFPKIIKEKISLEIAAQKVIAIVIIIIGVILIT